MGYIHTAQRSCTRVDRVRQTLQSRLKEDGVRLEHSGMLFPGHGLGCPRDIGTCDGVDSELGRANKCLAVAHVCVGILACFDGLPQQESLLGCLCGL